jgi:hypothetical protein
MGAYNALNLKKDFIKKLIINFYYHIILILIGVKQWVRLVNDFVLILV